ncbi:daptide biosynthesis intramembrane metalloprotease [Microbacterium sp. NPDC076768]|uniref:daptide biosynthesis intramembrane metalloprotease n=1 Tax=Microbacterium sp. NPDC076768 TaxID=3154858 RepID=UPI0034402E3F
MREPAVASLPGVERPELAPLVSVDAPLVADGAWIIAHDGVPKARISEPVAAVAQYFTGEWTTTQIARHLGSPWEQGDVDAVAHSLRSAGMLVSAQGKRSRERPRRWRFHPPLTVQFSLGNPGALFAALRPLSRIVMGAPGMVVGIVVVLAGVVAAVVGAGDIVRVLQQPIALSVLLGLGVAIILTTVVHEVGHGAALSRFGGSPRRLGAMLFYLAPAFFCDVTDGWRLGRRGQRVAVALAGPAVHLFCAAVSMVVSRFVTEPLLHSGLVLYAIACLCIAVLNLLPFVQLDGYLALMSALDRPHLRRHAMRAASHTFGRLLLGTRNGEPAANRDSAPSVWLVIYGVGCRLFPVVLVGFVLLRYSLTMAGLGVVPAAAYLLTLALVVGVVGVSLVRGVRAVVARKPKPWRTAVTMTTAAVLGVLFLSIPIQPMNEVGFVRDSEEVRLVASTADELPTAGVGVVLESNGILLRSPLGEATAGSEEPQREVVDVAALVPLNDSALEATASTSTLVDMQTTQLLPRYGRATFADTRAQTIGAWVWQTFVIRPFSAFRSDN